MTEPTPRSDPGKHFDGAVKVSASGPVPTYDRREAARRLGVSVDWLREHHDELPHQRYGRLIKFTDAHLEQIQRDREVQPTRPPNTPLGQPTPRPTGIRRRRTLGGAA